MSELISVIVPVYKTERCLERCIKSILSQTYDNMEIILVDDGSPDNCPAICDEWSKLDFRIRVIHKKNGGSADAKNEGLKIAKGVYVTFVDSDDYVHPQFIESLYAIMKQKRPDIVACEYKRVDEDSYPELTADLCCEDIQIKQISDITPETVGVVPWNKLYKKTLFDKIQFPVGKIHEDVGIWWELLYYAKKIVAIPEKLYFYSENPASVMRKAYTMKHMDLVDVLYMQYTKFQSMSEYAYAGKILADCLNAYPGLYVRLNNNPNFDKNDKKTFKQDYRQKVKEAIKNKYIAVSVKIKHSIYSKVLPAMVLIYKSHQKGKDVM